MTLKDSMPSLFEVGDLETKAVLKAAAKAHQALGEVKGVAANIPNQYILIGTLSLQEAKESSAIENIITTHDDLYRSDYESKSFVSHSAKEVHNYAQALNRGYRIVKEMGLITNNTLLTIQQTLEENDAGFRTQAGTQLKNDQTGEVIYTPPQDRDEIIRLMSDLERFINEDERCSYDDLVKMALIHHQFESIHPFYDGNGRTGRILNILYLVKQGLLDTPILYLSRYINQNKQQYYSLLQKVRDEKDWESWILYILKAVESTAKQTTLLISEIRALMQSYKVEMKDKLPKVYSHELLNNLFKHPYTKIDFVVSDTGKSRQTASKYLDELVQIKLLSKHKIAKDNLYLNDNLYRLLMNIPIVD
ncbi:Filamentation induced by cAMP protein Fic [Legionella moravica]|uniref:Protein adenylyltransferase n=1 Tax=Legionella moravica TaxID=39962 RepID=A0A378JT64_9GAMM|nr:Fic/DOC family N-terminal domain-containing protein [Legionella moravica]KTD37583.1 Filamentation induced by cAMP protein Fic [Legionella moravica]STX61646.1 Filamentation induced by cAMP protein Fic [Legionella moravica]